MTSTELKSSYWRDWAFASLRLMFVAGILFIIWVAQSQDVTTYQNTLVIGLVAGGVVVLITALPALFPGLSGAAPYLILPADWLLAGVLVYLTMGHPVIFVAIVGSLVTTGLLRLNSLWGSFHTAGVIAISVIALLAVLGTDTLNDSLIVYSLPMLSVLLLILGVGGWIYAQDSKMSAERRELYEITQARAAELEEMRQHARALTEMTEILSGTLNFEKVLDAALDIGLLSLRARERQRTVSMVLLFSANGNDLYIANSRGLQHTDEARTLRGREGIIARTLEECAPVIGSDASQDPELRRLGSFQGIRSMLCVPLRAQYDNYGLLIYGSSELNAFNEGYIQALYAIGVQAAISLQNAALYDNLKEERENIIRLEEEGRKALVRDLHDLPTQTIAAIAMRIRVVMRLIEVNPSEVPGELAQLEQMALRATEEIRHVLFKLRPLALESQGMIAALDQLAEKMQKTYSQQVTVKVQPEVERYLDSTQQAAVFYLIEEAVNNARKYAQASLIGIDAVVRGETIALRIADNGVGFDTGDVEDGYDQRGSFGMVNMRERAELLDGQLSVRSVPGKGTSIVVQIPLDMARIRAREAQAFHPTHSKLASAAWGQFRNTRRP